ncbi:MAG: acetyl-CoA carboxylase biotin carboxyl carrier protein [Planctomycetota bacterium]
MSDQVNSNPFDLARIRQLVRMMRENDLAEIDLRQDNSRLRLRRGPENTVYTSVGPMPTLPPAASAAPTAAPAAPAEAKPAEAKSLPTINSPIVGTFYRAASPEAENFVSPGSKVSADTVVCIIEAMKVFNEIPAGVSGTIREVLVENGAAVEYGQPLYRYEP